jgi:hypothetical protein
VSGELHEAAIFVSRVSLTDVALGPATPGARTIVIVADPREARVAPDLEDVLVILFLALALKLADPV